MHANMFEGHALSVHAHVASIDLVAEIAPCWPVSFVLLSIERVLGNFLGFTLGLIQDLVRTVWTGVFMSHHDGISTFVQWAYAFAHWRVHVHVCDTHVQ